mmetsp:Transcript_11279/g.40723  ORF Transcript_11279/g.40723 Transcript_11279/m.40723 type:complete len:211 (-) Transcript_11279:1501-2133(-)
MIATSFAPLMKSSFSLRFTPSTSPSPAMDPAAARPLAALASPRSSNVSSPPFSHPSPSPSSRSRFFFDARTTLPRRPVISATASFPPSASMSSSRKFGGRSSRDARSRSASRAATHSACSLSAGVAGAGGSRYPGCGCGGGGGGGIIPFGSIVDPGGGIIIPFGSIPPYFATNEYPSNPPHGFIPPIASKFIDVWFRIPGAATSTTCVGK